MSILNFINQDQLDDLDEDPQTAFMELVNIAQRNLHEKTKNFNEDEQNEWRQIESMRFSFMNVVLASAKRFEIEPFVDMEVPHRTKFDMRDYEQFQYDLDHYVTQLVLDNSIRSKSDTVEILPKSKDTIRNYIHALRECIEKANMTDAKREALLSRLDGLEAELEKRRVSMITVARVAFALWAIPGNTWASYEVANKLLSNLMHHVSESKEAEASQKKITEKQAPKALSAPRKSPQLLNKNISSDDYDNDIPF